MKKTLFEFWRLNKNGRGSSVETFSDERRALNYLRNSWVTTRKHLRVRHFYDRSAKARVIQFIAGTGWAVREGRLK